MHIHDKLFLYSVLGFNNAKYIKIQQTSIILLRHRRVTEYVLKSYNAFYFLFVTFVIYLFTMGVIKRKPATISRIELFTTIAKRKISGVLCTLNTSQYFNYLCMNHNMLTVRE